MYKFYIILLVAFGMHGFCYGQQVHKSDSIPNPGLYTPEQLYKIEMEWLLQATSVSDSLENQIINNIEIELNKAPNIRYTRGLVNALLHFRSENAYETVIKSLFLNGFVNNREAMDVYTQTVTYPIVKAIENANSEEVNMFREFIYASNYLNNPLNEKEKEFLYFLLITSDPYFDTKFQNEGKLPQRKLNLEAIRKLYQN